MLGGFMLYGEATLQANVLPRWCGVAFIAALPVGVATSILVSFQIFSSFRATNYEDLYLFSAGSMFEVFGVVWLMLGSELWERRDPQAAQQRRRVRYGMMAKRVVAYGVAVVLFVALVGGCFADSMSQEDWELGCHKDYYLWVIPVSDYCLG
jgi:uncharacterized membrane protein YidH (DUF202 family)